jgi:alkylated DNA repair dioxygenase AlkB
MQQLSLLQEVEAPPVTYWPGFLNRSEADQLMQQSLALEWYQNQFPVMGKQIPLPRKEAMFGDSESYFYIYSGSVELRAKLWPQFLCELRTKVQNQTGHLYQVVIGNLYRNGQDSISYHADNEPTLGPSPVIASMSLGATRQFKLKRKQGGPGYQYDLSHGDLLLMLPGCQEAQEAWVHAVPKSERSHAARINWTFRPYVEMTS